MRSETMEICVHNTNNVYFQFAVIIVLAHGNDSFSVRSIKTVLVSFPTIIIIFVLMELLLTFYLIGCYPEP